MLQFAPAGTHTLKRRLDDLARIRELLATIEAKFRRAFVEFVKEAASDAALKVLIEFLENGRVREALDFMDQFTLKFSATVEDAVHVAARSEIVASSSKAVDVARQVKAKPVPALTVTFNPSNPRAEEVARRQSARMVREINSSTRELVQNIIVESLASGEHPMKIAKTIQENVGLTVRQRDAVANYERLLRDGSREALQRDLRDRRSDSKVDKATRAKDPIPLSEADIKRLVEAYRKKYLAYRARAISRTEAQEALNVGRAEGMRQTLEQVGLSDDYVEKGWRSTRDTHVRRTHDPHGGLDGQKVLGMNTPFVSPSGAKLQYPGDPNAPAGERTQCRCTSLFRILSPKEREDVAAKL